jgi:magnesium chelatase subunit D
VIRRRLAYERDAAEFVDGYAAAENELGDRIRSARSRLPAVRLADLQLVTIARICAGFEVDGMRADIVTARTAVAHAAWHGRDRVEKADLRAAARLALPHRRRRNPFDAPGLDEELLDRLLDAEPEPEPEGPGSGPDESSSTSSRPEGGGSGHEPVPPEQESRSSSHSASPGPDRGSGYEDGSGQLDQIGAEPVEGQPSGSTDPGTDKITTARAAAAYRTRRLVVSGVGAGEAGRRSRAITSTGRTVGASLFGHGGSGLHLPGTIRAAAPHQRGRGRTDGGLRLAASDLRRSITEGRESNLVLFAVDASGSMAARRRMESVKTAILSLLLDAYQRRDKVGLVTFRGDSAALALPPTSSIDAAARRLDALPAGGRTPLAEGLLCAAETLRIERVKDVRRRPLLVVVTDGRATYGPDPVGRSRLAADHLRRMGIASVVVDCETGRFRMGLAETLSRHLDADHLAVTDVAAGTILEVVRRERAA